MSNINWFWGVGVAEVVLLACAFYYLFRFLRGTRSVQVLTGLILALLFEQQNVTHSPRRLDDEKAYIQQFETGFGARGIRI